MKVDINQISTQLIFSTIHIIVNTVTGQNTGTGHIYTKKTSKGEIPFIITNKHVVAGCTTGQFILTEGNSEGPVLGQKLIVDFTSDYVNQFIDDEYDLAFIPLGPVINGLASNQKTVFFKSIADEFALTSEVLEGLSSIEEITFIGYPRGISDPKNNLPIVRRGITSTPIWNNFNDRSVFLIDASSFPGSSGSPVFIFNDGMYSQGTSLIAGTRIIYCGILTETIRHTSQEGTEYLNLGVVVNAMEVNRRLNKAVSLIEKSNLAN